MPVLGRYAAKVIQRAWLKLPFVGADGYNISALIQLRAAMDTADYCIVHMPRARTFPSSLDILTFALSRVSIKGAYLEFGVGSGKTINHIAKQVSGTVHGFDSFEGLPEDWRTGFEKGAFGQKTPSVHANVQLHIGWFDKTLPEFVEINSELIAFLHVDCDLYSSTREIFRRLGPRIVPGTVIVFDEYFNHPTWRQDEHKAFQEFIAERRIGFDYIGYVPSHQQVCVVMKELEFRVNRMSTVRKNIAFLYILQGVAYVVPLVTLPFLSRVLGVEHFGVFGIAFGVVSVMTLITDWGFSLTATQQVARHANDPEILRGILWDTYWARLGLGAVSFLGLGIVMAVVPSIGGLGVVMLAAAVQVLTSMLSVGWFLQGLERMGALVTASIAGRALSIPLLVLFVHKPSDVALATLIPGLCNFIPAAVSFYMAGRFVPLFPVRFDVLGMWRQLRAGAQLFLSMSAVNLYTQSSVLILSALSATSEVGLYHGADRIRRAVQTLIGPVSTALFPRINNLLERDRAAARQLMWRMLIGQGGATFVLSVVMYASAPWGVPLALGGTFSAAVPVVQWLAPIPFLVGLNNVLGVNVMLPLGMKSEVTAIVTASAAINLVAMVLLCPTHGAVGAAISATLTETFVTAAMSVVVFRRSGYRWYHIQLAAVRRLWTRGRTG